MSIVLIRVEQNKEVVFKDLFIFYFEMCLYLKTSNFASLMLKVYQPIYFVSRISFVNRDLRGEQR